MAIVATDMAATVSTNYEVWFLNEYNTNINLSNDRFSQLVMNTDLPDFSGNVINVNWLGAAPQLREWVDEKRAQGLNRYNWSVTVKNWEATIEIDLNTFKDSRWNIYEPRIREMARNAARHTYLLISDLIINGAATVCYDGQFFYDTDHSEGSSGTQSNKLTGTGTSQAQIELDYYTAKSALMGYLDDKGQVLQPFDFRPVVWIPNAPLMIQRFNIMKTAGLISNSGNILVNEFDLVIDPRLTDQNDWYMFRTDTAMKPFININREEFHYEDNFGTGHPDVWSRRIGQASVVGRDNAAYALWQNAVKVTNT